jgi:hypothetical protein
MNNGLFLFPTNDTSESDKFDWTGVDLDSVIIEEQRSIAVYRNKMDSVVIRSEATMDQDVCIVLSSDDAVRTLIQALKDTLGGRK